MLYIEVAGFSFLLTMHHQTMLKCPLLEQECTTEDLAAYNDTAQKCVQIWLNCVWCFVDSLRRLTSYLRNGNVYSRSIPVWGLMHMYWLASLSETQGTSCQWFVEWTLARSMRTHDSNRPPSGWRWIHSSELKCNVIKLNQIKSNYSKGVSLGIFIKGVWPDHFWIHQSKWSFWYQKKAHIFLITPVNLTARRCWF